MKNRTPMLDLKKVKVYPLAQRRSLSRLSDILVDPDKAPPDCAEAMRDSLAQAACQIRAARQRQASVICFYGAHLVKNGGGALLQRLMRGGWITHLATHGAGIIHDWEFAFQERSTESVRDNVADGTFGTWDETGRYIQLALLAGGLRPEGFGAALGRFIEEESVTFPAPEDLESAVRGQPDDDLAPARAELLHAMRIH